MCKYRSVEYSAKICNHDQSKLRITAPSRYASAQGLARATPNCPPVTRSHTQATCQSLTSQSGLRVGQLREG